VTLGEYLEQLSKKFKCRQKRGASKYISPPPLSLYDKKLKTGEIGLLKGVYGYITTL